MQCPKCKTELDSKTLKCSNCGTRIASICKICGHIWEATPNNLLRGHGCPSCHYNKLKKSDTDFKSYNIENIKNDILNKFSNLTIVNEIKNLSSDASCECKKCGYKWTSSLRKLSNLKFDECCPMCSGNIFNIEELLEYLGLPTIVVTTIFFPRSLAFIATETNSVTDE